MAGPSTRRSSLGDSWREFRSDFRQRSTNVFKRNRSVPSSSLQNMGVSSITEAYFVFALGLLLSLNSGFINGLCLGGLLNEGGSHKQAVSAFTGTYTKSGLALADGNSKLFGFEFTLILSFIGGAMAAGILNPKAVAHKLVPAYGPSFLLGSCCMIAASIAAELHPGGRTLYYFAAMANGIQNGMTSTYSANLIRTTHLTGTSTDIGLIMGQMLRGNWKNYWKFKVLVGLAGSFWLGGLVSFYSATAFLHHSLWFSAGLYLLIGSTHLIFIMATQHVSFFQACVGNWKWDRVLERMATSMNDGDGKTALTSLTPDQVDHVFDQIDADGSGEIDADELKDALEKMGIKLTTKAVRAMIAVVDDNGDGVVDREEFHALVSMASIRAAHKKDKTSASIRGNALRGSKIIRGIAGGDDRDPTVSSESSPGRYEEELAKEELFGTPTQEILPRTYDEALPSGKSSDHRAIVVTETKYPFNVVGVNEPWEDLCGYKGEEATDKSMSNLIQGPKTNRTGLKRAMEKLQSGADRVECTTVNYRKDGTMFKNFLTMGPLYDNADGADIEEGKREPSYYVGILMNLGEMASMMSQYDEQEKEEKVDEEDPEERKLRVSFAGDNENDNSDQDIAQDTSHRNSQ